MTHLFHPIAGVRPTPLFKALKPENKANRQIRPKRIISDPFLHLERCAWNGFKDPQFVSTQIERTPTYFRAQPYFRISREPLKERWFTGFETLNGPVVYYYVTLKARMSRSKRCLVTSTWLLFSILLCAQGSVLTPEVSSGHLNAPSQRFMCRSVSYRCANMHAGPSYFAAGGWGWIKG